MGVKALRLGRKWDARGVKLPLGVNGSTKGVNGVPPLPWGVNGIPPLNKGRKMQPPPPGE